MTGKRNLEDRKEEPSGQERGTFRTGTRNLQDRKEELRGQ